MEATLMAAAGGTIGVLLGSGVASLVRALSLVPVAVRPSLVAAALALATAVGVVSGVFPSMKASRLQPTEALRAE
jgi:putative ABC transport system permease protein